MEKHPGIKNASFYPTGDNGKSHRQNRAKKRAQYLRNRNLRASLYARRGTMGDSEWHTALRALSLGSA